MGEVYRARDTRLERTVAVKVLPTHLVRDSSFRQRFEREAKALSSLSHANVCALYDIGQQDGTDYLVMEHLEGETLAARLARGPLTTDELLRYATQMAEALDAAHKRGVVHRDLKPSNIMLVKSGVKLLDFGLAKAEVPASPAEGQSATASRPLTAQGTILGTFQYMAPEQLEGKEADVRSDIFSFGAVLHEMATGQKAFSGSSQASLIGAIMHEQPPLMSSLQPMVPPAFDRVVRACLAKDPEDRWQTAHDVLLELRFIAEGGSQAGVPAPVAARRRTRERLAWSAFTAALLAAVALGAVLLTRAPRLAPLMRFEIATTAGLTAMGSPRISPDGRLLAFDATDSTGVPQIWIRPLDALEAHALAGTEGSSRPFWSPDSRFLGFMAGGKLKKIEVSGGPAQTICDAPSGSDGTWGKDGTILFDGQVNDPIQRVPATGGVAKAEVAAERAQGIAGVGWPEFLPDGRHFLYVAIGQKLADSKVLLRALDGKEAKPLLGTASRVQFAPPGYLLYVREETLVAQRFDARALKVTGEPTPIAENLGTDAVGLAHFSASETSVLTYRAGETRARQLVWVDRNGKELGVLGETAEYGDLWFSPDGKRMVIDMPESRSGNLDLWIRDLARDVTSRFTFDPASDSAPLWSPDGRRIVFTSNRKGAAGDLYEKDASGAGEDEVLLATEEEKYASDWSTDGRFIVFWSRGKDTGWDIWALPTGGDKKAFPVLKTPFQEMRPSLSPDARFVAYQSNESGRSEIYVREFPTPKSKWQISRGGGTEPFWSARGREIFYRAPDSKIMSVPVEAGPSFSAGAPIALFQARLQPAILRAHYRPSPDGQRFLTLAPLGRESILPTTVTLNWATALPR